MKSEHVFQAVNSVFGCIAVNALVDDVIGITTTVEVALQIVWIGLSSDDAVAGGQRIAEADDDGASVICGLRLCCAWKMERSGEAERKKKHEHVSARHIDIVIRGSE